MSEHFRKILIDFIDAKIKYSGKSIPGNYNDDTPLITSGLLESLHLLELALLLEEEVGSPLTGEQGSGRIVGQPLPDPEVRVATPPVRAWSVDGIKAVIDRRCVHRTPARSERGSARYSRPAPT